MLKTLLRRCSEHQFVHKKQMVDPAASNNDTLLDSAGTVSNSYRLWKGEVPAHLLDFNTHSKQLWLNAADMDTHFWPGVHLLDNQPSMSYYHSTAHLDIDKTCIDIVGILLRFFQNSLKSKNLVCSATTGTKPGGFTSKSHTFAPLCNSITR